MEKLKYIFLGLIICVIGLKLVKGGDDDGDKDQTELEANTTESDEKKVNLMGEYIKIVDTLITEEEENMILRDKNKLAKMVFVMVHARFMFFKTYLAYASCYLCNLIEGGEKCGGSESNDSVRENWKNMSYNLIEILSSEHTKTLLFTNLAKEYAAFKDPDMEDMSYSPPEVMDELILKSSLSGAVLKTMYLTTGMELMQSYFDDVDLGFKLTKEDIFKEELPQGSDYYSYYIATTKLFEESLKSLNIYFESSLDDPTINQLPNKNEFNLMIKTPDESVSQKIQKDAEGQTTHVPITPYVARVISILPNIYQVNNIKYEDLKSKPYQNEITLEKQNNGKTDLIVGLKGNDEIV